VGLEATGKQWLSFNAREDMLHGLTVGSKVDVVKAGRPQPTPALVTELVPLGPSRPGKPSEPSVITIATRCACASILRVM
jgi:hypothetical protein